MSNGGSNELTCRVGFTVRSMSTAEMETTYICDYNEHEKMNVE